MSKVALHTLGCKLNFSETSAIGKQFIQNGFSIVNHDNAPDVFVLNTCTVTENAEKECRQIVRRVLRQNPEAFVIVTGCYAQLRSDQIAAIPGVDLVLGSKEKFSLFEFAGDFSKNKLACTFVSPTEELNSSFGFASSSDADSRTRAFFKIQDGCDYKCSFCTIPLARGSSRSMSEQDAVIQFTELVNQGYKEIILTGVNVGDYRKDEDNALYLLLKKLVEIKGDFRIRISSIEPNLLTDEIIELTASNPKMCKHFHIPLQSGSSKILKLMQRRYKANFYSTLITKIVGKISDVGIGVDVITGFPGETDEDFMETYNFIKDLPVAYLHVFTYSERPMTKAIEMDGVVDVAERRRRTNMLRILSEKKKAIFYERNKYKLEEVLFENNQEDGSIKGFTSNYIRVSTSFSEELVNKFVNVELTDFNGNLYDCNIIPNSKILLNDLKTA
ncbi:MAG: tRNA (N(6)-L-threonylcarbamoyladenosine(37)-C(2))-methylthiotransferase MtaB [Ignavibacteriaceae bacterium]|nr:tRNA (N(6)-L-threonylcarbamoyladenosine(37)-C(2))-methylthiotransferase MtaB [Ignavibacteriaceae bacterium]